MSADLPVLLAGGVDPKDASPGIGAFITFLILALVIILLAWSFTRHQRRIRTNAARGAEAQEVEQAAGADGAEDVSAGAAADEQPAAEERPGEQPDVDESGAPEQAESPVAGSSPPAAGEDDGGGQR